MEADSSEEEQEEAEPVAEASEAKPFAMVFEGGP